KAISAWNVFRREYRVDSWTILREPRKIAKREGSAVQRAPDNPQNERVFGPLVRTVNILSKNFALAVEAQNALPDRAVVTGGSLATTNPVRVEHRAHNFSVARTPAKHAAERVHHFRLRRRLVLFKQRHGANQHSRRADSALRSAMPEKGFLQAFKGGT